MPMNILKLRQYIKVCDTQNITKAADALFISQSALSQSINSIENELGKTLFIRKNKSLTLTSQGETVLNYARRIVRLYDELESALQGSENISRLKIATFDIAFSSFLIAQYQTLYSELNISLERSDEDSRLRLLNGEIDLLFEAAPADVPEIVSRRLFTDRTAVLVPTASRFYGRRIARLADFNHEAFLRSISQLEERSEYASADAVTREIRRQNLSLDITNLSYTALRRLMIEDTVQKNYFINRVSLLTEPDISALDPKRIVLISDETLTIEYWVSCLRTYPAKTSSFLTWLNQEHLLPPPLPIFQ